MKNAIKLNNFPKDILEKLINTYNSGNIVEAEKYGGTDYVGITRTKPKTPFNDIKDIFPINAKIEEAYLTTSIRGRFKFHVDINRYSAINIPIIVNNGPIAFSKYCDIDYHRDEIAVTRNDGDKIGYTLRYNKDSYDFYNMFVPIVLNVKMPHGFFNLDHGNRVIYSIGFEDIKYEDLLKMIPKEWF
jgi:hypothetical protein